MPKLKVEEISRDNAYFIAQIRLGKKIVFTEGPSDKKVLDDFCRIKKKKKLNIISADLIKSDIGGLESKGLGTNSRDKIIYICFVLKEEGITSNHIGIIDRDFDRLDNEDTRVGCLEYTDYANMEMFFYSNQNLTRLIDLKCTGIDDIEPILNAMEKVLLESFFIREYNRKLNFTRVKFKKNAKWNNTTKSFEWCKQEYLKKFCKNDTKLCEVISDYVNKKIEEIDVEDKRYYIHGHDFIDLLTNLLYNNGTSDDVIDLLIVQCSDDYYDQYELFLKLLEFVKQEEL
jgi:hypothetical protein